MPADPGYSLVLTADQTLMASHTLLLDGMLAASQTTSTPPALTRGVLLPAAPHDRGQARLAPLGVRRVQAALLRDGFEAGELAVADEAHLTGVIGPATRLLAIGAGEPCGLGMNSTTMAGVAGGRIWPQALFERVLRRARQLLQAAGSEARIVVGGPGAWQLAQDPERLVALGVDHVVTGYCEAGIAAQFRQLLAGDDLPPVLSGQPPAAADIPPIRGAATMGALELSRGCGLGCDFCTLSRIPMGHLPTETILADATTNLAAGNPNLSLLSEDFLRYGGQGVNCRPEALLELLRQLRRFPVRLLQVDHVNAASVARYTDDQLRELHDLLAGDRHGLVWVNIGIESAAGELLENCGGKPKMAGVAAAQWGEFTAEQLRRLCALGYLPLASLVIGLPGETPEHLQRTLDWVRGLRDLRLTIYPLLYAPVDGTATPPRQRFTKLNWQLVRECYELNFRHMPGLYWDNQGRGGVSPAKRLLFQVLGHGQVAQWRSLLALRQWQAPA